MMLLIPGIIVGIILGVVMGISEWIPISSKTQVLLVATLLLGLSFTQSYALGLFLEGGTFIAALIYFRREVWIVLKAIVGRGGEIGKFLLKYLVVVTVITAVLGGIIYEMISSESQGPVLGIPMIILGVILVIDGLLIKFARSRASPGKTVKEMTFIDLVIIGICQGVSALPGVSRSGTTVSGMLILGVKPEESFRLSFLALIPASIGATAITLLISHGQVAAAISAIGTTNIIIAIAVSIVVSLVFIRFLLKEAASSRITTIVFVLGGIAILGGLIALLGGLA